MRHRRARRRHRRRHRRHRSHHRRSVDPSIRPSRSHVRRHDKTILSSPSCRRHHIENDELKLVKLGLIRNPIDRDDFTIDGFRGLKYPMR